FASIAHFKNNSVGLAPAERGACCTSAESDRSSAANGFSAVANEVDEHLFQMAAVGVDKQLRIGFDHELHFAALQIWRHQSLNFAEQRVSGEGFELGIGRPGKTKHVLHDAFEAGNLGADDVRVFARGRHG